MKIILTPEAEADLENAHTWYLGKGSSVGADFLLSFASCMASIEQFPDAFPIVHHSLRRAVLRRFPYNVFYAKEDDAIYVHAVFHSKRLPQVWQRRAPL